MQAQHVLNCIWNMKLRIRSLKAGRHAITRRAFDEIKQKTSLTKQRQVDSAFFQAQHRDK